jgi:predicted metal-binding protein
VLLDGISVATLKVEAIFVADIYIDARVALASGRGCVGYGFPEAFMTAKFVGH